MAIRNILNSYLTTEALSTKLTFVSSEIFYMSVASDVYAIHWTISRGWRICGEKTQEGNNCKILTVTASL